MKKIFTNLFLLAILFLASTNLTAQTYNDGTWYSLYEAREHTIGLTGNYTYNVYSPTTQSLTFDAKRDATGIGNLHVAPIVDENQQNDIYNQNPGKVTKRIFGIESKVDYTDNPYSATTPINLTQLKFYHPLGGSYNKYIKNVKLPLAKHILLNDGTSFGTTSVETQFANSVTINETSEALTVQLRSFLTAGDSIITSDNNTAFSVAKTKYSVGNNACASAKGAAGSEAGGSTLGNINQYDVHIYFHPTSAGTHNGTITLTDGTSTATIKVSGTCNKKAPEVTSWPQAAPITYGTPLTLDMLVGGNANVPGNFEWAELPTTLNVGTHNLVVRFVPEDQNIYATVENTISVVVNKADQTIVWDFATTEMTVDEVLTLSATATAGDVTFALTGDAATLEGNTLIAVKAGEITITASQAGNDNYNAAEEVAHTITIHKATPIVTAWPTLNDVVYGATYGESLQLVGGEASVEGAFSIINMPADLTQVPTVGEYTYGIVFTPAMSESYNEVSDSITLKVTKNLQTITLGFADQELLIGNTLTLSATAPAGEVTFAIESAEGVASLEGNTLTALAAGKVTITATAPENENYEAATISHIVTVIKHTPEITTLPTVAPLGRGTALADTMLIGGEATTEGTWSFINPSQALNMGNNEVAIRFTPTNTDRYNTVDTTITVEVTKATQEIIWDLTSPQTLAIGETIVLNATATSMLPVDYEIEEEEEGVIAIEDNIILKAVKVGTVVVHAVQEGDEYYSPAIPVSCVVTVYDPNAGGTGITNTTITGKDTEKVFINGKLYIIRNNQWYDTTGKLVK